MAAGNLPLYINQGATFTKRIQILDKDLNPVDLTGYTGTAKIKRRYTDDNGYSMTVDVPAGTSGYVDLSMTATETLEIEVLDAIGVEKRLAQYCYDVLLVQGSYKDVPVEGVVYVSPLVTK